LRGEARDYDTLLKAVMRMYETAGVDVYIKAKDKLEKKTRGYL
jgi:hypothetical protein